MLIRGTWLMSERLPTLGPQVVQWQRDNLVHGPGDKLGQPYEPEAWMNAATYRIYEYDPVSLVRPVRRVLVGVAKGNAKTEWAAAQALTQLAGPVVPTRVPGPPCPTCGVAGVGEPCRTKAGKPSKVWHMKRQADQVVGTMRLSPDVPIGAASREQANLCFGCAKEMVKGGALAPFFNRHQYDLTFKDNRVGKMYRIAAEAGTQDGTLCTCFVADEVHEWIGRTANVHTVVTNSLAKRAGGLEINITTAGDPQMSDLLLGMYEYGMKVQSGEVVDPSFLFMWVEPKRKKVNLDSPKQLRQALRDANPSSWIDIERLAHRWEVERMKETAFRRYHLNQWVVSGDPFIESDVWDGLASGQKVKKKSRIVMGFDGSYSRDSTALVGCTVDTDKPHVFGIGLWENPHPPNSKPGKAWKVPRKEVDDAVDKAFRKWDIVEFVCDPARWTLYMDDWVERYGDDRVIEYPNSPERMVPATSKFNDAVTTGLLTHDGSPMLARHVANAIVKTNPRGKMVRKDHPDRKIDALVAALMAHDRATWRREEESETGVEIW